MGMQGPLIAQALGRSPYDEVVQSEGEENPQSHGQQYDARGRPINPVTKRINRDIIRSHNEVMLVIGVAEPENQTLGSEAESQHLHIDHEGEVGVRLLNVTRRCVDAVGILGFDGLRQRILTYRRYSLTPFRQVFRQAYRELAFEESVLAGAPSGILAGFVSRTIFPWYLSVGSYSYKSSVMIAASYVCGHLELFATMQRLGLVRSIWWLPSPAYFIPFTDSSPLALPPLPATLTISSLLAWTTQAMVGITPFIVWVMARRVALDCSGDAWQHIYGWFPNTLFRAQPPLPLPPPLAAPRPQATDTGGDLQGLSFGNDGINADTQPINAQAGDSRDPNLPSLAASQPTTRLEVGDDDASDDDEHQVIGTTLISFDVEATESMDVPTGLWSAELRPTQSQEPRTKKSSRPLYFDTLLTRGPSMMASQILSGALTRIVTAPCEAIALRIIARSFCIRNDLPLDPFLSCNLLSGVTLIWAVNFLGSQFLHLSLCSEVWSFFTLGCQWLHVSDEEWKIQTQRDTDARGEDIDPTPD